MSKLNSITPIAAILALGVSATGCSTMMMDKHHDHQMMSKSAEGKCGGDAKMKKDDCDHHKMKEGQCGGDKKMKEGECDEHKMKEGKCGGAH